jgi:RNA polymerase sigma-70 factor (ECF subfamily)
MDSIGSSGEPAPYVTPQPGTPSSESEKLLVSRALQGWNDAFADLLQPCLKPLNQFARTKLHGEFEAEDVVQQSVLRALSHLGQFRGEASFKTWLGAIALNEALHCLRGRAVRRLQPLHTSSAACLADPTSSPYAQYEQREKAARLHKALTRLPQKYRLIIQLRDLGELSIAETARSLSLTSSVVRTRHHRARKLLIRSLSTLPGAHDAIIPRIRNARPRVIAA